MDKQTYYILKRFSEYYAKAEFQIPEIEKREFGAGIEKKIDFRHMAFANANEFRSFLVNKTPLYISHSVAYYQLPAATPMEKKGWLGADLIFDLDYETNSKYLSKADFENIRNDTIRLVEEFLIPDFGILKEKISINFSGNRGFHVHAYDERFRMLRSEERREIIEYVRGLGLNYESFFFKKETGRQEGGRTIYMEGGPLPAGGGYTGRFAKKVLETMQTKPERFGRIFKDEQKRMSFINGINSGNWSLRKMTAGLDKKLREIAENELPMRTVAVDSAVTRDATKLIRVPNTIHGSTGLCAKIVSLKELQQFEPMHHALAFSKDLLNITALEEIPELEMNNCIYEKIECGKNAEVPECFGIYLALKGSAKIIL